MEGATLGGRSITNMIAAAVPEEARSFFQSYGSETRDRWLQFIGALEAYAEAQGSAEETVQAASESFSSLDAFLREQDDRHLAPTD
jgi:heme oxygenase